MPNSAPVNPGDDLLSAQYNTLRDDVLNTASGHDHSGEADHGKRVHHGATTGLDDDDHPQYPEHAEAETISGVWTFENPLFTQYLKHAGDLDTFINFQDNNFQVDVGGKTALFLDDVDDNVLLGADAGAALDPSGAATYIGHRTGAAATDASSSVGVGSDALHLGNASSCVAIGCGALEDAGTTKASASDGDDNVAVGCDAMHEMDAGKGNVALGYGAMWAMEDGDYNVSIGYNAMQYGAGYRNIAIGMAPMGNATTASASENIALGTNALYVLTDGCNNIGIGCEAMMYVGVGNNNVAVGYQAGYGHGSSAWNNNVFIGYQAGLNIEDGGDDNVIIGYQAGLAVTTAVDNVIIGAGAGSTLTTGSSSVAVGYQAMQLTGTGVSYSVAVGHLALQDTGKTSDGDYNTAVGYAAMLQADQGEYNVAVGASALQNATNGDGNTAVGMEAMASGTGTPINNVAIGYQAMYGGGTSPTGNVAIGMQAGLALNTGNYNVALGMQAMRYNAASHNNVVIGYQAGYKGSTTTYDNCVIIGHQAGYLLESGNANVFVGYQAGYNETGSNKLYIANSSTTTPLVYGEFDNALLKLYGTLNVGTAENYLAISSTGIVTLVGTAKRVLTLRPEINIDEVKKQTVPDQVPIGVFFGYSMPLYVADPDNHEELYFKENVPGRWDGASDITVHMLCCLASAETTGEDFNFQVSWNQVGTTDVVPATTHDVTHQIEVVDGTQYATYELTFTIDYDVDVGDPIAIHDLLAVRLRRVAATGVGVDEVDGEVIVLDWHTHYQVDKMFKAA